MSRKTPEKAKLMSIPWTQILRKNVDNLNGAEEGFYSKESAKNPKKAK